MTVVLEADPTTKPVEIIDEPIEELPVDVMPAELGVQVKG
jgi:hypothetical protein